MPISEIQYFRVRCSSSIRNSTILVTVCPVCPIIFNLNCSTFKVAYQIKKMWTTNNSCNYANCVSNYLQLKNGSAHSKLNGKSKDTLQQALEHDSAVLDGLLTIVFIFPTKHLLSCKKTSKKKYTYSITAFAIQ